MKSIKGNEQGKKNKEKRKKNKKPQDQNNGFTRNQHSILIKDHNQRTGFEL